MIYNGNMIQSSKQVPTLALGCKADQIMNGMIEWLKSGDLSVGAKLPTERELAQRFGVSLQTVNKAMSRLEDASLISRTTGRGTYVTMLPSQDSIAVIWDIKHLSSEFHAPSTDMLIGELIKAVRTRKLIPHFIVGRGDTADQYIDSLGFDSGIWRNIKGVISHGWREGLPEKFESKGIPMVTISAKEQGNHAITFDYRELGKLAARSFAGHDARRIGILHNSEFTSREWNNPLHSFREELERKGFPQNGIFLIDGGRSPEDAIAAVHNAKTEILHADGLFITDDNLAAGFAKWLELSGTKLKDGFQIVVQANKGVNLGIPANFRRISFDLAKLANKSVEALVELRDGDFEGSGKSRVWIKPEIE